MILKATKNRPTSKCSIENLNTGVFINKFLKIGTNQLFVSKFQLFVVKNALLILMKSY